MAAQTEYLVLYGRTDLQAEVQPITVEVETMPRVRIVS